MQQYNCVEGQSLSDVVLNTYGTMDNYIKFLDENNLEPEWLPRSGQVTFFDNTIVENQTVRTNTNQNGIIYATLLGYSEPPQVNPIATMYKDVRNTSYTASADGGETEVTITDLQNTELIQLTKETKELKPEQYTFNPVTGKIILTGEQILYKGQTLFALYKVTLFV